MVLATIVRTKGIIYKGPDEVDIPSGNEKSGDTDKNTTDDQDYVNAKRDFESEMERLQPMKFKQIAQEISAKMPSNRILVHDPPVIAESPVSPNVTLNLTLGAACGLLFSPLLALPLAWLLNRRT